MIGGRSKPEVPVQPGGRIAVRRIAHAFRRAVAVNPRLGARDLADFSGAHKLDSFLKMFSGALLRAYLHDAVVLRRGLHHLAALSQRM